MKTGRPFNEGNVLMYLLIVVLLAAILLAVTNPGKDRHMDAINEHLANQDALSGMVTRGMLAIDPPAYHSVIVLSYTTRKDKMSTFGLLGYV